jgi:hypothetical protein
VRGDEFTGFQRREAGGRGGPWYSERRLRLKIRSVSDQRAAGTAGGEDGADAIEGGREGAVVLEKAMMVEVVVMVKVAKLLGDF